MVPTVLIQAISRILLLPIYVTAVAFLVKGASGPGDGFSAGVTAATGVLLQYVAFGYRDAERLLPIRFAPAGAVAGLLLALLIAFVPVVRGEPILTYFPPAGEEIVRLGTLELTTALAFDVGVFLIVFGFSVTAIGAIARASERRWT